jgi:hypothetical protein
MIPVLEEMVKKAPRNEAENDRLYPLLASPDAREAMVVNNIRLLQSMVTHFVRRHPQFVYLEEDLVTEGITQLVQVVKTLATISCDCPTAYIITSIRNCLYLMVRNAEIIRVPRQNRTVPPRAIRNHYLLDRIIDTGLWDETRLAALEEEICDTPMDHRLITLRRAGYTYAEIADQILSKRSIVHRNIRRLRDVFLKLRLFSRHTQATR